MLGAGLGLRDPWPSDEPRFALVAKHMVETGDVLFPRRGTELYADKPPLLMWAQAAFHQLTGEWRIAFLLPSLLAALGTLWCVHDLGRRLWSPPVGRYAAWALLLSLQFAFQAKRAQIDPLVVFWITLANWALLRHLLVAPDGRLWALGWAAAGLGTITKGVGALALLMLLPATAAAFAGWGRVRLDVREPRFWLGPLAFVVTVSIWLAPMLAVALTHAEPGYRDYVREILFQQTAQRYAHSWNSLQPPWYFAGVIATLWLPTALLLPFALAPWRRRLARRDPRYLLPLVWVGLVLVFFSIPAGKRDVYILPALPMLCLALAPLLPGLIRRRGVRVLAFVFAATIALTMLSTGLAIGFGEPAFERKLVTERGLVGGTEVLAAALAGIGLVGALALAIGRLKGAIPALATTLASLWITLGFVIAPLVNDAASGRGVMAAVEARLAPDDELAIVAWKEQMLFMASRPATTFGFATRWSEQLAKAMTWQAEHPGTRWLLVQEAALTDCIDRTRAQHVGLANRRQWWLVPSTAVADPTCKIVGIESQNQADGQDD
ncbi:MAG TPA: glycosyltransferase family 39 protein [Patescibacteria group bacterium]|nr:glycosyltransferase family 39 protein [Patescibacteria group bacterium]